jgi:3D (Asp-Asp-Asp) domain-containing protein
MNQRLSQLQELTNRTIKEKEQKERNKKFKKTAKKVAWTILMISAGACWTITYYQLQDFRADYLTAVSNSTRIIENRHAGVVKATKEVTPSLIEENTEQDTSQSVKTVTMTGYTSRESETDGSPCISADGTNICEYDGCVVASNGYDLGTIIEVEGFGKCTVLDRMNRRYDENYMDMYFGYDLENALKFGKKEVTISVLS